MSFMPPLQSVFPTKKAAVPLITGATTLHLQDAVKTNILSKITMFDNTKPSSTRHQGNFVMPPPVVLKR